MNDRKLMVLMYHAVVLDREELAGLPSEDRPYAVIREQFEEHLRILKEEGNHFVSPDMLEEDRVPENPLLLTFDDGYRGVFMDILPQLRERGIPGMVFVTAGRIGQDLFFSGEDLRVLSESGIEVGSHTVSHAFITRRNAYEELARSREMLEKETGKKVRYVSLPGGRSGEWLSDLARETGYKGVFTSRSGLASPKDMKLMVPRFPVRLDDGTDRFRKLAGRDPGYLAAIEKNARRKQRLRNLLGNTLYYNIYKLWIGIRGN